MQGVVKLYNPQKQYGFIVYDNEKHETQDVFFHVSQVPDENYEPRMFDVVEFDIDQTSKRGPQARNVRLFSDDDEPASKAA